MIYISNTFREFERRVMADPGMSSRIAIRLGFQPSRDAMGAILVHLAMDEIDGHGLATPALDNLLDYLRKEG